MTLALLLVAALGAAVGTQAAALLLVGAAVAAALTTAPAVVVVGTWTAALAAGAVWLTGVPRRLALPILGAAAVIAAGRAPNAAAILALWTLGSVAFVLGADALGSPEARRWGVAFLAADLPFAVGVVAGAASGFQDWPSGARGVVTVALAIAAAGKVALARSPTAPTEPATLLAARTQALVAVLMAVRSAPHGVLQAVVVFAGIAFAVVPHLAGDVVVDVAQETALFALAAASAAVGWGPRGWTWAVLAAGTLIHHLRLSTRKGSLGTVATLLTRGGLVGLAYLPIVVVELEGAARARPAAGAVLVVTLLYGSAARSRPVPRARLRRAPRPAELAPLLVAAGAFAASIWAPLLSSPRPPAGAAVAWLPPWAAVAIAAAAVAGGFVPGLVRGPARVSSASPLTLPALPLRDFAVRPRVLEGLGAILATVAAAMWVVGAIRGFL